MLPKRLQFYSNYAKAGLIFSKNQELPKQVLFVF